MRNLGNILSLFAFKELLQAFILKILLSFSKQNLMMLEG